MYASYASPRERTASALAAGVLVLSIALMLLFGLRVTQGLRPDAALASVLFAPPEQRPPKEPERKPRPATASAPKGDPGARNLRNQATPVVAPRVTPLIPPPPIVTATQAGVGAAAQTGASNLPGPGQGAGGVGDGLGGGGDGGDGDGGVASRERQIRGRLSFRDLPDDTLAPGQEAAVGVRYFVNVDGRVSNCRIDEPSGYPQVDAMTCRLIEERFVFRPARNRAGRPVRITIVERHTWFSRERLDDE